MIDAARHVDDNVVVGDHEARGIAARAAVAPPTVALGVAERLAAHHERAGAVEYLLQMASGLE